VRRCRQHDDLAVMLSRSAVVWIQRAQTEVYATYPPLFFISVDSKDS
jgi:hypothetical protein